MICTSLDVYLFSFFSTSQTFQICICVTTQFNRRESCFRNSVNGDCKLLSNMFPHTVQRCSKNSQGRKLQRKRLLRSSHQNGPLFKLKNTTYKREKKRRHIYLIQNIKVGHFSTYVSVVAFCDFRQRLWPLSGLDRRPY